MGKEKKEKVWGKRPKMRIGSSKAQRRDIVSVPGEGNATGDRPTFRSKNERRAARKQRNSH